MQGLLQYSLERISSLQHFYNVEKKSIESKAKKGMRTTRFGYLIDVYFQILINGSEEDKKEEGFLKLKEVADTFIEVKNEGDIQNPEVKDIIYRVKTPEKLKGVDLNVQQASASFRQYSDMPIIHGSNTLIMLITRFEEFIANFLSELYRLYPHKYLDKQQIAFSEIENLGIDKVREKIIAREIDSIMRESYSEWFKIFESHGLKFDSCEEEMNNLREIYSRRNIIVHNSGRVNETYIKNIPNTPYSMNDRLTIDDKYINGAFNTVKVIVLTIFTQASKLVKEDRQKYLIDVFDAAYNELEGENYPVCSKIFYQLMDNPYLDAQKKTMSKVNYWISEKESNGLQQIKSDVEQFDISALDSVFSLAKALLLNENDKATNIFEKLYTKKEIPFYVVEEWPLFKEYRKSKQYTELKHKHQEELGTASLETGPDTLAADKNVSDSIHEEIKVAELPTQEDSEIT